MLVYVYTRRGDMTCLSRSCGITEYVVAHTRATLMLVYVYTRGGDISCLHQFCGITEYVVAQIQATFDVDACMSDTEPLHASGTELASACAGDASLNDECDEEIGTFHGVVQ